MTTKTTQSDILMRWLIRRDMPIVLEIESRSFRHPWTEEHFSGHINRDNAIGMVATHDSMVVGYTIYAIHTSYIEILNLATHPDYRRMSVGRTILNMLKRKLVFRRRGEICLYISEVNLAGQLFFKANGFQAIEVCKDMYATCEEDAYLMSYRIGDVCHTT
jgi:ribosomal-protein-alanine N-acetyltransferase